MDLGHELVNAVLTEGKILPALDTGLNQTWLSGIGTGVEAIFTGVDKQYYQWLLDHYKRHHKVPTLELFKAKFPTYSYKVPKGAQIPSLDELLDLATERINSYLVADIIGRAIDLYEVGEVNKSISLLRTEGNRLGTDIKFRTSRAENLNSSDFNVHDLIERNVEMGVPFGIYKVDDGFYGFQPGQLITVLGRQKSGKTTFLLNSALQAWKEGYTVLFFSVEMDVEMLRERLYALGAHVSPSRMRRGHLRSDERNKVVDFHEQLTAVDDEDEGRFFISKKRSLITVDDVIEEASKINPHVIYVDGFSFMLDRRTNRMTDDWQANENVAAELKVLSLDMSVAIVTATQVQEKQYHPKFGIEARTIAGGTGLLKASDLVIGLDKTNQAHTISCVLSRYEYFPTTVVELDWDTMSLSVVEEFAALEAKGI